MDSFMRLVNHTARCFNRYRSELLEREGLTGRQHQYLLRICEDPGMTQDQLAERLGIDKSNVARQLVHLEKDGFVTRVQPPTDRRLLQLFPTERAQQLYPKIKAFYRWWNDQLLEGFSESERAALQAAMEQIRLRAAALLEGGEPCFPAEAEAQGEEVQP